LIKIKGQNSFGVVSSEDASFSQRLDFENFGKISALDSEWWCIIVVHGSFTNHSNAKLSLFYSAHSGIFVDRISTFNNNGNIVTEYHNNGGNRGIGNFINRGFVLSDNNGENGINFYGITKANKGSVVNYGGIELFQNVLNDISLGVELHNTDKGYIYTEESLDGSKIVNDGIFSVWHNRPHNITFENKGVLQDVYNSLPNIDNKQIVLSPLRGPLVANTLYSNALDKDSGSNTTIGNDWFDKLNNGNIAAHYFTKPNSLVPESFGAGAPTLWMDVTIQSSGLNRTLRVNVLNTFSTK